MMQASISLDYRHFTAWHDRQSLRFTSYQTLTLFPARQSITVPICHPTAQPSHHTRSTPKCPHGRFSFRSPTVLKKIKSLFVRKKLAKRPFLGKCFGWLCKKISQKGPFIDIEGHFFVAFGAL